MSVPEKLYPSIDELPQEADAISRRLVAARTNAAALPDFPGKLPDNLPDAYAIQSASIARWPDEVAGWKVGGVPTDLQASLSAERLVGPIFRSSIHKIESGSCRTMPIFKGGFAALEAEYIFELASTIEPVNRDFSDVELIEFVSELYVGVEIASSPMAMINVLGPCCVVPDFGNNAGLLVGPNVPNWSSLAKESLTIAVTIDDVLVGASDSTAIEGGPLQALRFLIHVCAKRGVVLAEGTLVSTGAVTGIHEVQNESKAKVDFGSFGSFNVAFESMSPKQ